MFNHGKKTKILYTIKRDFISTFRNEETYLKIASGMFQQPSYHARKILELLELYDADVLDKIIEYAIDNGKLDIKSIKQLIKNDFFKIINNSDKEDILGTTDVEGITRSCNYYDEIHEVTQL